MLALNTMCTPDIADILLKLALNTMCTPDIAEILLKLALNTMCTPDIRGGSRDSVVGGGLSYGAIFSIIDGTNCSPKAVLACRSVNLVFISFRDGPFNFQGVGGYGFFLKKKYSDSQCC